MIITCDSHMHTSFSSDSDTPPEQLISRAISLGLKHVYFTDHMDYAYPDPKTGTVGKIFTFSTEQYFQTLLPLQRAFQGKLQLHIGVELGLRPEESIVEENEALLQEWPFAYCIGSVHVVDEYDPYYPEYWEAYGEEAGIRRYYQAMQNSIQRFDGFDALGHIDYIIRYSPSRGTDFPSDFFLKETEGIFQLLIQKDKALELNTAGWKYGLPFPHPAPDLLKQYYRLGGRLITVGSDGHEPAHIAWDFDRVAGYLRQYGFQNYVRFENRVIIEEPLPDV